MASFRDSGRLPSGSITSTLTACSLELRNSRKESTSAGAAAALRAGKIERRLLDEGHENRVKREIVGEIVQAGGKQQDAALADFLFEQQRRLVASAGRPRGHRRDRRAPQNKISRRPSWSAIFHGGIRRVGVAHVQEAVARAGVIVGFQNAAAKDRDMRAVRGRGSFRDPHAAAGLHISQQGRFQMRREPRSGRKERRTHISREAGSPPVRRLPCPG